MGTGYLKKGTSFPCRCTTVREKYSAILAKAEIHPVIRHSRESGNPPHHPSFPRRRESTPSSVIPAKAGIHNSRACGNSSSYYPNTHPNTPATPMPEKTLRHSREGGNLQFPRMREFIVPLPSFPRRRNPQFPRMREFIVPLLRQHPKKHSVIPAKAGIYNSRACGNSSSYYRACGNSNTPATPMPEKTLRHSREGGNLQFPRMREFIVPLPQCPKKHSVIPAKAGIHNSRINSSAATLCSTVPEFFRDSSVCRWECLLNFPDLQTMDSRLHGNDAADLHENDVPAGVVTGKYPRHSPHSNLTMQIYPTIVNPAQDQRPDEISGLVTGIIGILA